MGTTPTSDSSQRRALRKVVPGFDPATVRCAAETKTWAFIEKKEDFHKRLMGLSTEREAMLVRGNLELRTDAYRVDTALTPAISNLRETVRAVLRVVQPIDVFVKSSPELNAFCHPVRKGTRFVMCLYSPLFQLCTPSELLFVMGHELGHALLGQTRIPRIPMGHPDFSPLEMMRLSALSRRQELSCDRIGLLACQDIKIAASALFKIMSGLPDRWTAFDENAVAREFDNITDLVELTEMDDAVSTHPIIALRVKALIAFSQSKLYSDALALPPGPIATEDLERTTEHLLSILEPDLEGIENASEEEAVGQVLNIGALAVMAADGVVDPQEADFIRKVLGGDAGLVQALKQPDFSARALSDMRAPAAIVASKLSDNGRASLLYRLCNVALLAGGYSDAEKNVVIEIAKMLDISPDLYRNVVGSALAEAEQGAGEDAAPEGKPRRRRRKSAQGASASEPTAAAPASEAPTSERSKLGG